MKPRVCLEARGTVDDMQFLLTCHTFIFYRFRCLFQVYSKQKALTSHNFLASHPRLKTKQKQTQNKLGLCSPSPRQCLLQSPFFRALNIASCSWEIHHYHLLNSFHSWHSSKDNQHPLLHPVRMSVPHTHRHQCQFEVGTGYTQ
jgi:hypothetical protein